MKDHKEDFKEHKALECRLIKPSKSDLGKISKRRLEIINQIVRDKLKSNQWKSKNPENKQTWRKPSFHSLRKLANFCWFRRHRRLKRPSGLHQVVVVIWATRGSAASPVHPARRDWIFNRIRISQNGEEEVESEAAAASSRSGRRSSRQAAVTVSVTNSTTKWGQEVFRPLCLVNKVETKSGTSHRKSH